MEETHVIKAQRIAATTNFDFVNRFGGAARFILSVTNVTGTTPNMTVKFQARDPIAGTFIDIPGASFAAKTAISTDELVIDPGITAVANRAVNNVCPGALRAVCTLTGSYAAGEGFLTYLVMQSY